MLNEALFRIFWTFVWENKAWQCRRTSCSSVSLCSVMISVCVKSVLFVGSVRLFSPSFLFSSSLLALLFSATVEKVSSESTARRRLNSLRKSELRQKHIDKLLPLLAKSCNPDTLLTFQKKSIKWTKFRKRLEVQWGSIKKKTPTTVHFKISCYCVIIQINRVTVLLLAKQ